jgi:hypothetical protein
MQLEEIEKFDVRWRIDGLMLDKRGFFQLHTFILLFSVACSHCHCHTEQRNLKWRPTWRELVCVYCGKDSAHAYLVRERQGWAAPWTRLLETPRTLSKLAKAMPVPVAQTNRSAPPRPKAPTPTSRSSHCGKDSAHAYLVRERQGWAAPWTRLLETPRTPPRRSSRSL